jgi:hypothetical protein
MALTAVVLRPVLAAAAEVQLVISEPLVAVAAVASAFSVWAQRVLVVSLPVVAVAVVLAVRTVLHQPQMQERRVAHTAAAVAALMMTGRQVPLVVVALCVLSTPVRRAHSHRQTQETYKWNTQTLNFTSKSVTGSRMSIQSLRTTFGRRFLTWTQRTCQTRLPSSFA